MGKNELSTRDMVLTALMIALVFLAGSIIKVPTVGGFVHLGDCMVFLSVIILGKKKGAFASAVGMFLVDVLGGYLIWAPFTFVIKGIMGYIAGTIMEKNDYKQISDFMNLRTVVAYLVSAIFMVVAYFLAGSIIAGLLTEKFGIIQGLIYASKDIVGNIVQVITGAMISIPLSVIVLQAKKRVMVRE